MTKYASAGSEEPVTSAKTQKAPSVLAQYGPSMARNALLQSQALHRFRFGSNLRACPLAENSYCMRPP